MFPCRFHLHSPAFLSAYQSVLHVGTDLGCLHRQCVTACARDEDVFAPLSDAEVVVVDTDAVVVGLEVVFQGSKKGGLGWVSRRSYCYGVIRTLGGT